MLRHEVAYVLGQMQDPLACGVLEATLADKGDNVMVRHECAEALGAIGASRSLAVLEVCAGDAGEPVEVRETSEIALNYMKWKLGGEQGARPAACACMLSPYSSVDPAPPSEDGVERSVEEMKAILADPALPLFKRYAAMFGLRNRGGADAVAALASVLVADASSAVLRHEVAYVLGQMQHPGAVEALATALRRPGEHNMVRHEAAEALGAVEGGDADMARCRELLGEFSSDADVVVRESCAVALDAQDYWGAAAAAAAAMGAAEDDGAQQGEEGKILESVVDEEKEKDEQKGSSSAASFKALKEAAGPQNHFNVKLGGTCSGTQ